MHPRCLGVKAMTGRKVLAIYDKEIRSLLRDKKALMTMLLPVLIYPVMMFLFLGVLNVVDQDREEQAYKLLVSPQVPQSLVDYLKADKKLEVILDETLGATKTLSLDSSNLDFEANQGYLMPGPTFYFHSSQTKSADLLVYLQGVYEAYVDKSRETALKSLSVYDAYMAQVPVTEEDISGNGDSRLLSMILGMLVPYLVVLYGLVGTFTLSSDLSAGEKERATLETIFSVPVKRSEVIFGKLLACVTVGIVSGLINLVAMFPLVLSLASAFPAMEFTVTPLAFVVVLLHVLPIMVIFSAVFIGMGMFARTYQESQSYGSLVMILLMVPTYVVILPEVTFNGTMAFVPISNAMLLMRDAIMGTINVGQTLMVMGYNVAIALAAVAAMAWVFGSDRVIFGGDNA